MTDVTVRELPNAEWDKLRQIPECSNNLPDPGVSTVVVAEDPDGNIIGYCFMYLALHIGPFELSPEYRKRPGTLRRIWRAVSSIMARLGYPLGYAVIMDNNLDSASGATRLGFQKIPGSLYFVIPKKIDEYAVERETHGEA